MFRFFRRNQKVIIVVGGVILMFVFLIGDSLQYLMGNNETVPRQSPNATFATWDGGKLTNAQYGVEYEKRRILNEFIRNVVGMGQRKAMDRGIEDPMLAVLPIGILPETRDGAVIRSQIVSDKMLAEMAKERGMRVSRQTLQAYLAKLGLGELSSDDMTSLLTLSSRTKVSGDYILDALEEQFLAKIMLGIYGLDSTAFSNAFRGVEMPYDRWQTWRYVNDLVSVEAAALNVDDYRIDVPAPTDEQLKSLYDEFKDVQPRPVEVVGVTLPNPNPAFAIPRKIKLQYLHVNYDETIERLKGEFTEEEVAEYYEKTKGYYIKAAPLFESLDQDTPAEETPAEETPPAGEGEVPAEGAPAEEGAESPAEMPTDPADAPEAGDDSPETPADPAAPSTPAGEAPEGEQPAAPEEAATSEGEPAAETEAPEAAGSEEPATPGETDGATLARGAVHFVSLQSEEEPNASGEEPAGEEPAGEEPSDESPAGEEGSDEQPSAQEPEGDEPVATGEEGTPPAPDGGATPAGETDGGEEGQEVPPIEYEPLEKVADDVRKRMAEERYNAQMDKKFSQIMARLRTLSREYRRKLFDAEAEGKPAPKAPAELADLSQLAAEFGVNYEQTVELGAFEMLETDVGSAMNDDFETVTQLMFSDRADLYQPIEAAHGGGRFGDRYIVMKIADVPGRVPPFDEIKSQVRDAWIKREAAKIALKRAEEFAAKAQEAGQSLKDFFDGNERVEVVETNAFSRYTQGGAATATAPEYKLSEPAGLKNVGPKFMDEVFSLKSDEVGAVLNFDETIAYVVRVANPIETEESLQSNFLAAANAWEGRMMFQYSAAQERARLIQAHLAERFNIEFAEDEAEQEAEE